MATSLLRPSAFLSGVMQRRVVVTGLGTVNPLGLTVEETWKKVIKGESGISRITKFDPTGFDAQIAGEVKGFNPDLYIEKKEQKKMDEFIQYALAGTQMALAQSQLNLETLDKERTGVFVGTGIGGFPMIEEQITKLNERGPGRISPFFIPATIANLASGQISIKYGFKGPNFSITSACATGVHSLGEAAEVIRRGVCDVMIAGGTEAAVCKPSIGGFAAMKALSTRNDDPTRASRPFDKNRDGFVLSEGCAVFVIESLEHALARNAPILCEITGYGVSSDAYHFTSPAPGGAGAIQCMKMALKDAGLQPHEIHYINAHATSTPVGDGLETAAIKSVMGDHAKKVWVSSTKAVSGHLLGAAGALESLFCIQSLVHQMVPPTMNLEDPSEDCDLDYVPQTARDGKFKHVLNNSFGFGGTNACLVFSKLEV